MMGRWEVKRGFVTCDACIGFLKCFEMKDSVEF